VSLGGELWDTVSPGRRPRAFRAFPALEADGRRAPATGGDLLLHATARRPDLCFELALRLRRELGNATGVLEEVHGFRYLDLRDLTGFIDGTENPKGRERAEAALVGAEDPAFAGGSFVFAQRYVHDLVKWAGLSVREQEGVFGRRKRDSHELSDRTKPPTAHIARTVIEGARQGARDRPPQLPVRHHLGVRAPLHRIHERPRHPGEDAAPHAGRERRRAARSPDGVHARRLRRDLLRAIAATPSFARRRLGVSSKSVRHGSTPKRPPETAPGSGAGNRGMRLRRNRSPAAGLGFARGPDAGTHPPARAPGSTCDERSWN
jgi:hypothetical protein